MTSSPSTTFDVGALAARVSDEDVSRFRVESARQPGFQPTARAKQGAVFAMVAYGLLGLTLVAVVAVTPAYILLVGGQPGVALGVLLVLGGAIAWPFSRWAIRRVREEFGLQYGWAHRVRLWRFAASNGMQYTPDVEDPMGYASVLATGSGRRVMDLFASRSLQVGNYRTVDRYNNALAPRGWGFIRIRLDRRVPHMLLLPKKTRRLPARAIVAVRNDQILRLEGDFNRHFTLYVPDAYERDALYVLAPNLMALLIDELAGAFVEVFDEYLVIALPTPLRLDRAATWSWIGRIVSTVGATSRRQTARYQDERSAIPGRVAREGVRLRVGISLATVVAIAWMVLQLARFIHPW